MSQEIDTPSPENRQVTPSCSKAPRLMVGVGASAGGLNALSQLLQSLPADTGMAFILVQHLSPTHKSIMAKLLAKHTAMPVLEASDGLRVAANHVYMIPPDSIMSLYEGHIRLAKPLVSRSGKQLPVNEFFISLADDASDHSAGVILSGTGSDGTQGLKAIKEAGGLALVQDPDEADYPGMPRSAAATGLADFLLPIPELAGKLADFARQPHLLRQSRDHSVFGLGEKDLLLIVEALHVRTGYDFREYKKPTLSRRIQRRMGLRNVSDPKQYTELLNRDEQESTLLFKDLLIGVTSFFRDRDAFTELGKQVLAPLVKQYAGTTPIRIWIPGCTTGEEAYSVAMLLDREFKRQRINFNAQIFATDIDEDAVSRARTGRYAGNIANEVPEEFLRAYFDEEDGGFTVKKMLRESVTFAVQNLIGDPPFSKLDLICCRNVLIYLEPSMQNKLLQLFHFALSDSGCLFLGSSESVTRHESLFSPVAKQNRIFRKNPVTLRNNQQLNEQRPYFLSKSGNQADKGAAINPLNSTLFSAEATTREALLAHYAPPAVLINASEEILYYQGETSRYLNQPEGEPTNNLCAIAVKGLKTKIRAAVRKARQADLETFVRAREVKKNDGSKVSVTIAVYPVKKGRSSETLFLVTFNDEKEDQAPQIAEHLVDDKESELSSQLEYELFATRQDLQSTIEQLETSNEELKASNEEVMSMNEELQSSNEELETSREELQSLNEELNTVNSQLEDNVRELESVNNDLSNLLSSTDIATIFLDANLRIRRFTPATHNIIHLIDSDVGRPLADLAMDFRDKDLIRDARRVLETLRPSEKEVSDSDGQHYLRRITLYRTADNRIEGVVLTFTDITPITNAMNQLQSREKQQALVAKFGQEALAEPDLDALFEKAVQWTSEAVEVEMCKILELRNDNRLLLRAGMGWKPGLVGRATVPADFGSQAGFTLACRTPVIVEDLSTEQRFNGPNLLIDHHVTSGMSVIIGPQTDPFGVIGVHTRERRRFTQEDVNFIQAMANGLWAAIQRTQTLNEITAQAITLADREEWLKLALTSAELNSAWIDLNAKEISHYRPTSTEGGPDSVDDSTPLSDYLDQVHEADRETVKQTWQDTIDKRDSFVIEYRMHSGGETRWVRNWGQYVDLHGWPRLAGITMDVTHEKESQARLEAAKQEADASNQAKSAFLANMSHEIRTPLTAILGYTDLVHMEQTGRRRSDDYLHKIKTNGQNLLEIINEVLDLSKVEADRIEISQQEFAIKTLLAELLSLMHLRAREKFLDFRIEVEGRVPALIDSDMNRLKQILINLISNAIKFTRKGSVRLVLSADASADKQHTTMIFKVIDTGIGIDADTLNRIFDPFEQGDSSVATNYGGTGLGLTISKRISELLGGRLNVESSLGEGSTFTLSLPVGDTGGVEYISVDGIDALVREHAVPAVNAEQLRDVHILVVDDVPDVLALIQEMLKKAGATVSTAVNGREAMQTIETCRERGEPVDMILMDTMMPVMDGFTAVTRLRQNGFTKPIIALTAAAMANDRDRCLQVGFNDYLSKPVRVENLLRVLRTQLAANKETTAVKKGAKVLIIEDNLDAGEAIKTLLDLFGYACRHACDGKDGIAEMQAFEPDVVLLDLTLPDMNGYAIAERLRSLSSGIRLIALSGEDLEQQKDKLAKAGFTAFLQKPVGRTALATYFPALAETES